MSNQDKAQTGAGGEKPVCALRFDPIEINAFRKKLAWKAAWTY
jgi:hypothetical protein